MQIVKSTIGIIAILLTFIGYIPYLKDITNGKTKPHIFSWFLWGFVTSIVFALQISGKAGIGAFVTLTAALMCISVIVFGYKYKGISEIVPLDTIFLIFAFIALGLWLYAKQPILATILATVIDLLGFVPTIRKSWNKPYSETLSFYYLNTLRFLLAIIALQNYNIVTSLYPISWFFINGLFALTLVARRKVILS